MSSMAAGSRAAQPRISLAPQSTELERLAPYAMRQWRDIIHGHGSVLYFGSVTQLSNFYPPISAVI